MLTSSSASTGACTSGVAVASSWMYASPTCTAGTGQEGLRIQGLGL